jgi:Domain of unknown function (DUF1877)
MGVHALCHAISNDNYGLGLVGSELFETASKIAPVDLDKAWHAIHFLLTGDCRMTLLLSGVQVPIVSEHCELHSAASIHDLYSNLKGRHVDELMAGFNGRVFDDLKIYPGPGWTDGAGTNFIEPYLQRFVDFVRVLSERDLGLMVVIS